MVNVKEIIESLVNDVWNEFPEKVTFNIPPLTIEKIPDAEIIFIGLNPSLKENDRKELLNAKKMSLDFYELDNERGDNHKYYKKFHIISEKTNLDWSHYDLLFIRETKQDKVKKLLQDEIGLQFIYKQLMISKLILDRLIDEDNPKIFVVNNTLSREFLGKDKPKNYTNNQEHWLNYKFDWNEALGTYIYKNCPFFFTSMLTGQRALDNGSFERLIWHINFVKSIQSIGNK